MGEQREGFGGSRMTGGEMGRGLSSSVGDLYFMVFIVATISLATMTKP